MRLSPGQAGDGVEGRALLQGWEEKPEGWANGLAIVMDNAYEGNDTRACVAEAGFIPVVPPKANRKEPWEYDNVEYYAPWFRLTKECPLPLGDGF